MGEKQELEKQIARLRMKLSKIEAEERRQANASLVGKCFRYRNGYGSEEHWWLYAMVTEVTDFGWLKLLTFQTTSRGEIQIDPDQEHISLTGGYKPISAKKFEDAWHDLMVDLSVLSKPIAALAEGKQ